MIDIIIPTYEGQTHLERCLMALEANTILPRDQWRIVIADDNSPSQEMRDYLRSLPYRIIPNQSRRGFPSNCNYAVSQTDGEFIVLLNSDTQCGTGWLGTMMANMADSRVGIVGARLLYPASRGELQGKIQHAGVARDASGNPYHIWRNQPANHPPAMRRRRVNAVTFACALIRRTLWEQLHGLDEGYVMGQFEDCDFCYRTRELGWHIIYEPQVWIYHYEHGSGEDYVQQSSQANHDRLIAKWSHLGSDEYLFWPIGATSLDDPETRALLAGFLHRVRGAAMLYAWQRENHDHRDHCRRLAGMEYGSLPDVEKAWANAWMERFVAILKGVP